MLQSIQRVFQIPELRAKIIFTLLMLVICRIGVFVPVPGINGEVAVSIMKHATGGGQNLFQLVDIFSGGAFAKMTVLALGVVPYISASIIMQLLIALVPTLQREIRESPDQGRRKPAPCKATRINTREGHKIKKIQKSAQASTHTYVATAVGHLTEVRM